jgi:dipeptidyl aminopeptidase/acylaminoacyl peptidase
LVSDLLFIQEKHLRRWNSRVNFVQDLDQDVTDFSVAAGGGRAVLLRSRKVVAGGQERFQVELLDLVSLKRTILLPDSPRLYRITLSPDGRKMAYSIQEAAGSILQINIDHAAQPIIPARLGECGPGGPDCETPVWSRDGTALAWAERQGTWIYENGAARLAVPAEMNIADPKGRPTSLELHYSHLTWSPSGRYLLARATAPTTGAVHPVVLDTRSGRAFSVEAATAAWLPDGRLCAATAAAGNSPTTASDLNIYQVLPTRDDLLLKEKTIQLRPAGNPSTHPVWIAADGEAGVVLALAQTQADPLQYIHIDLASGSAALVNELPPQTEWMILDPDGSGLLTGKSNGSLAFAPAAPVGHSSWIDLTSAFGRGAFGFTFLPPAALRP